MDYVQELTTEEAGCWGKVGFVQKLAAEEKLIVGRTWLLMKHVFKPVVSY